MSKSMWVKEAKGKALTPRVKLSSLFKNEDGAIDLASIMVGVIVVGLIGGVVAATVFAVIPWSQDNAAKQQLDSIASAQSAYKGLSSSDSLPDTLSKNSYADSYELNAANLLSKGTSYCTTKTASGGYEAFAQSASGETWMITDSSTQPQLVGPEQVSNNCGHILPYIDATPAVTTMIYRCDTTKTGIIPLNGSLTGKETWSSEGAAPKRISYNNRTTATPHIFQAGVEYTMTFEGTYKNIDSRLVPTGGVNVADCLREVEHIGKDSGVVSAAGAFYDAKNLISVPSDIPETITNFDYMFYGAKSFNHPNISSWNTSNVTTMTSMFDGATVFNQPVDNWNTSNVTSMSSVFAFARDFNQPLNDWDTSKVTTMSRMFSVASSFNQPVNNWDVSKVVNMGSTFNGAYSFNQPLDEWDVRNVIDMNALFSNAYKFNQPLNNWNPNRAALMNSMFNHAYEFNQPLDKWNTSKVTNMNKMFYEARAFSHDLSGWNTSSVTNGTSFALPSFPEHFLPAKTSK